MTNRCSPHDWAMPIVGDTELVCVNPACGRRLPYGRITINMRVSIAATQYRLGGDEYGETFEVAYAATHDALYPPVSANVLHEAPSRVKLGRERVQPGRTPEDAIKPPGPSTLRPSHRYNGQLEKTTRAN